MPGSFVRVKELLEEEKDLHLGFLFIIFATKKVG